MEAPIYNIQGKDAGKITLPDTLFGLPFNADLLHQTVVSMQANARGPVAHTKDRGEVRGGGKKPWQQKGTGRARHGSSRSPIWTGGGVAHGPRNEKSYAKKINRTMRRKALFVALSQKLRDGEVFFVDTLGILTPKAAQAKTALTGLSKVKGLESLNKKRNNAALIATPARDAATEKSFGNFGNIAVDSVANLNPVSVLASKYVIIVSPKEAIEELGKRTVSKK